MPAQPKLLWIVLAALLGPLLFATGAAGFAIHSSNSPVLHPSGRVDTRATLEAAIRWSAVAGPNGAGLHDGLQVGVQAGFEEAFAGSDPVKQANYRAAIEAAFGYWATPEIQFDITFDSPAVGPEVFVSFADSSHPVFAAGNAGSGFTLFEFDPNRRLTNGALSPGLASYRGVLIINVDFMSEVVTGLNHPQSLANFEALFAHEVGHILGLGHPDEGMNFDTDGNPVTPVIVDATDPFGGFSITNNFDPDDLMFNPYAHGRPQADDLAGRDVLYPVPEPGVTALLAVALGSRRRRTRS